MYDNDEETAEPEEQEQESEVSFQLPFDIETQWQRTRRLMWTYFTVMTILSMYASLWIALTLGGWRFWASTVALLLVTLIMAAVTYPLNLTKQ